MRSAPAVLAVVLATLALPLGASASKASYVLKRPAHEHCKAHDVKKVEWVKVHGRKVKETVCVYVASKTDATTAPTTLPTTTSAPTPGQGTTGGEAVIYGLIFVLPSEGPCERCSPPANLPPSVSVSDPGVVTVTNASTGAQVEEQKVAAGSAGFRVIVPAGAYVLGAVDEAFPTAYCPHDTITVAEGQQVNLSIGCEAP
jgi:hypothetical protein